MTLRSHPHPLRLALALALGALAVTQVEAHVHHQVAGPGQDQAEQRIDQVVIERAGQRAGASNVRRVRPRDGDLVRGARIAGARCEPSGVGHAPRWSMRRASAGCQRFAADYRRSQT